MGDNGETTTDINLTGRAHPAEAEADLKDHEREEGIRRRGSQQRWWGAGLIAFTIISTLVMSIATGNDAYTNPIAELFGVITIVAFMTAGASLFLLGWLEKRDRYSRAVLRADRKDIRAIADGLEVTLALVGAVPHRISQLEHDHTEIHAALDDYKQLLEDIRHRLVRVENVVAPESDYVKGIEDGMRAARDAHRGEGAR